VLLPDNDVLVYYPIYDAWADPGELIRPNPVPESLTNVVMTLWEKGCSFDYVSDRFLAKAECKDHKILLGGNDYKAVLVPECRMMPETTLANLVQLAKAGAIIIFQSHLPVDVPGFGDLDRRRSSVREILARLKWTDRQYVGRYSEIGTGRMVISETLGVSLGHFGIIGEPLVRAGVRVVRRKSADGFIYFLANRAGLMVDKELTFQTPVMSAIIFDPRFESHVGLAQSFVRRKDPLEGRVHLQLQPGESCIVRTFTNRVAKGPVWHYVTNAGPVQQITGTWKVNFIEVCPMV